MGNGRPPGWFVSGLTLFIVGLGSFFGAVLYNTQRDIIDYGYPDTADGWSAYVGLWLLMIGVIVLLLGILLRWIRE